MKIRNFSKIQRLNLELKSLDEENERIIEEITNIKSSLKTIDEDIDREKSIVIDANSNEKRLKEEKSELIEIDSKYYETEKQSNEDLDSTKNKLKIEIDRVKELINDQRNDEAITALDNCKNIIEVYADSYSKNQNIKKESVKRNERINTIEKEIEGWQKYNALLKQVTHEHPQVKYEEVERIMKQTMVKTIGTVTITEGKPRNIDSKEIKNIRKEN